MFAKLILLNLNNFLYQLKFDNIMEIECPNNVFNAYMILYKEAFESVFPNKPIWPNRKYITRKSWVTPGILVSSRTKGSLLKNKLQKPSLCNIELYI